MVVDLGALDAAAIGAVIEGVSIGNYAWERYLPEDRASGRAE